MVKVIRDNPKPGERVFGPSDQSQGILIPLEDAQPRPAAMQSQPSSNTAPDKAAASPGDETHKSSNPTCDSVV